MEEACEVNVASRIARQYARRTRKVFELGADIVSAPLDFGPLPQLSPDQYNPLSRRGSGKEAENKNPEKEGKDKRGHRDSVAIMASIEFRSPQKTKNSSSPSPPPNPDPRSIPAFDCRCKEKNFHLSSPEGTDTCRPCTLDSLISALY
ncbi:hypothetical protein MLD38_038884 [Melastoma candidum]|uniref:Uncharacterized protein n=1 Tax=Melastoma candidum TaxID=119954 RepID=A0ACB9L0B4_9MYRT|nr:hypothetical protein MLD38_038884 [Melastoma candidum]